MASSVAVGLLATVLCLCTATAIGVSSVFPQAAPAFQGCPSDSVEDPQLVGNLLEQLSSSTEKFISCRQQLTKQKYHLPIIIGSPFADSSVTLWQSISAVVAVLCVVFFAQARSAKSQHSKLQQHVEEREAAWQKAVITVHTTGQERLQRSEIAWQQQLADWKHKEAEWQQGVQEVVQLVQQREAALSDSPSVQQASAGKVGCKQGGHVLQSRQAPEVVYAQEISAPDWLGTML